MTVLAKSLYIKIHFSNHFSFLTLIIILFFLSFTLSKKKEPENIIIKKINHGSFIQETWKTNNTYIYYVNISNYNLNEENPLEIVSKIRNIFILSLKFYLLTTDSTEKKILSHQVYPTISYTLESYNIKTNSIREMPFICMPFKKTLTNQTFFILKIEPRFNNPSFYKELDVEVSLGNRIPKIVINNEILVNKDGKRFFG